MPTKRIAMIAKLILDLTDDQRADLWEVIGKVLCLECLCELGKSGVCYCTRDD